MKRCYLIAILLVLLAGAGQAQVYWQSDFGPWGGRVNDLYEDAGGTLYAATMQGVSVSTDEGRSWDLFALDGEATSDIHRSMKGTFLVVRERQLLRSTDGGTHWEVCHTFNIGVTGVEGECFSGFFEHSSGALFHRRSATCYVSTDDGVHWERFDAPRSQGISLWSETEDAGILTGGGLHAWPDRTEQRYPPFNAGGRDVSYYLMHSTQAGKRIAFAYGDRWYFSGDGGTAWMSTLSFPSRDPLLMLASSHDGKVIALHEEQGFLVSDDAGRSWRAGPPLPITPGAMYDVLRTRRGVLLVATGSGIIRLEPGSADWIMAQIPHMFSVVGPLLPLPDGRILAALPLSDEIAERSDGGDWKNILKTNVPFADLERSARGTLFAATQGNGLLSSTDGGSQWNTVSGISGDCRSLLGLADGRVLLACNDDVLLSTDDGNSWTAIPQLRGKRFHVMAQRGNGEILFGGEEGVTIGSSDLNTWRGTRFSWLPVMTLAENADGVLFAGTLDDGLYRSADDGLTWTQVAFAGEWITGMVTSGGSNIIVSTRRSGIHESRDGGLGWNPYGSGLRSEEILDLVAGMDGHLYAGTVRGLARSTYPVLTAKYLTPDFTLEQNTPNPATDVAVFGWSIPHAGHVRMSLYDVLGRELAVLLDAPAEPGLHWESVDTRTLVPGTYFCVLRFEGQLRDRKFQVVR